VERGRPSGLTMLSKTFIAIVALFASLVLLVLGNSSLGTISAFRLQPR
jgi:hypothetical protein